MPSTAPNQTVNPAAENGRSRKETTLENEGSYRAKRYALKYQPPCIFLEYEDVAKNRRVRAVKLTGVQANVDVDRLTRKVIRSFPRRLDPTSVKHDQIRRLVVALVDYLNNGAKGTNGGHPGTQAGVETVANGLTPARNGTSSHGPSRLGPGGGSSGGGAAAAGSKALSRTPPELSHRSGASNGGAAGVALPLPSMSPRGLDPRNGPAARLAISALDDNCRGSIESTMSRFSTSTASPSSSGGGCSGRSSGSDDEEEEEEEDVVGRGGGRGGGCGSRLDFALDELEKEMAGMGDSGSDFSSMVVHGGPSGGGSLGVSSELGSDSRTTSVVSGLRDTNPLPPLPSLTTTATTGSSVTMPAPSSRTGPPLDASAASVMTAGGSGKTRFAAETEKLVIGLEVTDDLDLNKVTEVELRMAKQAMESDFKKNQLKPGDPGYVYDKQEDFGPPTEANDWDDSGDEEDAARSEEPEVDWVDIHASVSKPKGAFSSIQANTGRSSEGESTSRNGHSPYNSNDWP